MYLFKISYIYFILFYTPFKKFICFYLIQVLLFIIIILSIYLLVFINAFKNSKQVNF